MQQSAADRGTPHASRTDRKEAARVAPGPSGRQGRAFAAPGSTRPTLAWAKANGFTGEAGRSLLVPGPERRRSPRPCSASASRTRARRSAPARWRRRCRKATGISPTHPPNPTLCDARPRARRLCLHPLRQESRQGHPLRRCLTARTPRYAPARRRRRLPGARPRQHADQRHGAGRAGAGGPDAGAQAQGEGLGRSRATISWRRIFR